MELMPDLLRAIVSTTMNVLLMLSLTQPKYGKRVTTLTMIGILAADLGTAVYCYLAGNLTLLARIDIVWLAALCFIVRPLFKDTFMQWLFSYVTVQNASFIVIILSFLGSRHLPYPVYANTVLRLILFSIILFVLHRYARPLYRQMVNHWNAYFYVSLAIFATFSYYVFTSEDIVVTFTEQAVPLLLVIIIAVASYISIGRSLSLLSLEYAQKEDTLKMQNDRELLRLSVTSMSERLHLMDEAAHRSSLAAHDRRHFNSIILELLEHGQTEEAAALLRKQSASLPLKDKRYCENVTVNSAVSYYAALAEANRITTDINLDIPAEIPIDALELSMTISNLLENAIHGCQSLSQEEGKTLRFLCRHVGRLAIEISNPCVSDTMLDENGYPVAEKPEHGVGTKSVLAFAEKYGAELFYRIENGMFTVRLLV